MVFFAGLCFVMQVYDVLLALQVFVVVALAGCFAASLVELVLQFGNLDRFWLCRFAGLVPIGFCCLFRLMQVGKFLQALESFCVF